MGINYCLSTLKQCARGLRYLETVAIDGKNEELKDLLDSLASQALYVAEMVQNLAFIYAGCALTFESPSYTKQELQAFKKGALPRSELEHHLPKATDEELYDTYREIGRQPFTVFEVLVHRAVRGLEIELEELKEGLYWDLEEDED